MPPEHISDFEGILEKNWPHPKPPSSLFEGGGGTFTASFHSVCHRHHRGIIWIFKMQVHASREMQNSVCVYVNMTSFPHICEVSLHNHSLGGNFEISKFLYIAKYKSLMKCKQCCTNFKLTKITIYSLIDKLIFVFFV